MEVFMKWFLPLVLSGCTVTASIVDPGDLPQDDVDLNDDVSEDDASPTDTDDPVETESDVELDPADFLVWRGLRVFDFDSGCYDEVSEVGVNVTGESGWEDYEDVCPDCAAIFSLTASPDAICDGYVGINTNPVRGIASKGDGELVVYAISDYYGEVEATELARGDLDENELVYEYDSEWYGYEYTVEGTVEFE